MELYEAAMQYIGTPWRYRGRSKNGMDCSGLLVLSVQDSGGKINNCIDYTRELFHIVLMREIESQFTRVEREPEVNDILVMSSTPGGKPFHIAIVAPYKNDLGIIHTYGGNRGVIYTRLSDRYKRLIVGVYV